MEVFDAEGNTPLYYAAMHGNNALIEFLLRNGANPNTLCREDTPLHMAVKSQKLDVSKVNMVDSVHDAELRGEHGGDKPAKLDAFGVCE